MDQQDSPTSPTPSSSSSTNATTCTSPCPLSSSPAKIIITRSLSSPFSNDDQNDYDEEDEDEEQEEEDNETEDLVQEAINRIIQEDNHHHLHNRPDNNINCGDNIVDENEFVDPTTTPNENDEYSASTKMLDGKKMLEVTEKLFRSTERDPDRDLRKQVLLKTALRNLPHFVHYQHYNNNTDLAQPQYDDFDSVQQQYNQFSNNNNNNNHFQPNAIEVSTTSMRMLDLNDDDREDDLDRHKLENVEDRVRLSQKEIACFHDQLDDGGDNIEFSNQFDDILFNRHNSFDNLYQSNELNESNENATNHHISWNIGYKIFEFPSIDTVSKVSKILNDDELQEPHQQQDKDEENLSSNEPTLDQQSINVTESNTSSSITDDSLTSDTSQSDEAEEKEDPKQNGSGNSIENSFYPVSSSPRTNKRRSSFDYEDSMDIDLAQASAIFETSPFGQYKRLRKNFEKQSAPLIETTSGGF